MPPGCTVLCLTFHSQEDLNVFQERCKKLRLPSMRKRDIVVRRCFACSDDKIKQLSHFLKTLEFSLAFQAHKVVVDSILEPLEVISIKDDILKLQSEYGAQAYALFQYFAETLKGSRGDLPSRQGRRDTRRRIDTVAQAQSHPPSLSQQLDEAVDAYSKHQNQLLSFSFTSPTFYLSYHLIITPSDRILEGGRKVLLL
jgi:RNA-dependent RNA polymerase